jgi:aldehyde:ferredoxin oxidoreductase
MASKYFGYAGRVLRLELTKRKHVIHPLEKELIRGYLGGRGFNSKRLLDEIPPETDPLGKENKLMFATGPLVGTGFPTASRFNVSAKSPLTWILGDSNAGGHFAPEMKYAGYDQIILEGSSDRLLYIFIDDDDVSFIDASHLAGLDVYETTKAVKEEIGDESVQVVAAGPAAENGVRYAGVFANLMRAAARTGMGTVMAQKGVKAIAIRGSKSIDVAHPDKFEKLVEKLEEDIYNHPQYWPRRIMGTTRILLPLNLGGFLPTRHFTTGVFEYAEEVSGERLAEEYNVKTRGCFSCILPCSRFWVIRKGKYKGLYGEGPEYEPLSAFSARVGNPDIQVALKANDMCNKLGLDALTTAECISWAMECYERGWLTKDMADGLDMSWGNEETILTLIEKIARREGFGDILADGVKKAAEKLGFGEEIALHVKGLEIIQADPRGLKGYGLGYVVASRGGDHLRSEPFFELSDDPERGRELFGIPETALRLEYKGKGKLVSFFEDWCAITDALEVCKNVAENMEVLPFDLSGEVIHAATGIEMKGGEVRRIGERIINVERLFLVREGISRKDDTLPKRFLEEPMPEEAINSAGSIFELEPMLNEYYTERGWDLKTGIPTIAKIKELGLEKYVDNLRELSIPLKDK